MKLKVQHVFDATQILAVIINEKRRLPQKGVYRITRMHAKMFAEFSTINDQRTAKIVSYGYKQQIPNPDYVKGEGGEPPPHPEMIDGPVDAVPDDKMPEFIAWWKEMAAEEIEVAVEPIPLDQLCIEGEEGTITFAEFSALGDLVCE